jgi:hypothetical protein
MLLSTASGGAARPTRLAPGIALCGLLLAALGACGKTTEPDLLDAVFVAHDVPATLEPRQIVRVAITVRNTGEQAWVTPEIRLAGASTAPSDDAMRLLRGSDPTVVVAPFPNGVPLPDGVVVAPGSEYTFRFLVQAADEERTMSPGWRLETSAGQTFGQSLATPVQVTPVQYAQNPFVIRLAQRVPAGAEGGGMIAHDLDNDGRMDYILGTQYAVGAYAHDGRTLWVVTPGIYLAAEWQSLAGGKRPGVMAGDMDGDGKQEVAYIGGAGTLRILDGETGVEKRRLSVGNAEVAIIANIRGLGDQDAVLQADQTTLTAIRLDTGEQLWTTGDFRGIDKRPAREADLDGDGKDEFCGSNIIGTDGRLAHSWDLTRDRPGFWWHDVDSIAIGDIIPGGKLEVAIAEQGGHNEVIVFNQDAIQWGRFNGANRCCEITKGKECIEIDPDKVALGDFSGDAALEIFAPSACGRAPWVLDSSGQVVASWIVDLVKPADWTIDGIEDIFGIDWFGDGHQRLLARERFRDDADVAIIDAMTGQFQRRYRVNSVRVYAADVSGDYREEAVALDLDGTLKIFWEESPAPLKRTGYWSRQYYRRQKQNWNHYSP